MYKLPIIITDDYIVFMEPNKSGPIVHCDIKSKWTQELKMQLKYDWYQLRELQGFNPMYALHYEDQGNKHIKFLKMMGFKYLKTISGQRQVWSISGDEYDK